MRTRLAAAATLLVAAAGCSDQITPAAPSPSALFSCLLSDARQVDPGDVLLLQGAEAELLCLDGGGEGSGYLFVPFFASQNGRATLTVDLSGGGFVADVATPARSRAADGILAAEPTPDDQWHHRFRQREIRELTPLMRSMRGSAPSMVRIPTLPAVPQLGELRAFNTTTDCRSTDRAVGRVEAISRTAIVVADTANPPNGFTERDWRFFAEAFDTLVNPVTTRNFGEPSDIDDNDRVIIFFTRAVNERTPPGSRSFVGGFFWGGDLLPNRTCQGSNTAEMFYMLVPDPQGVVNQNPRSVEFVRRRTVGVLAHEYQHLINASHRIYLNPRQSFEEVWLNEGLSHIAEELLFYRTTGLQPEQNIDVQTLRRSPHVFTQFVAYAASNFARFEQYLEDPDAESLLGIDNLPTRGASWAFLRYLADHRAPDDAALFRRLVDGREVGVRNISNAVGEDALDLIQAWTVSVFTDDFVPAVPPLYTQPSWNFRSVMGLFSEDGGYPLEVITPEAGGRRTITLKGGGSAFVRFRVPGDRRALLVTTSGGATPPEQLRTSVVRLP